MPQTPGPQHRTRLPRLSADTWETVFGVAYLVVMTNVALVLGSLPLVVLLVTTDPVSSWPVLAVAAVAATPAVTAAFAVFRQYTLTRGVEVVRTFCRAWVRHLRRSLAVGTLLCTTAVVLGVDVVAISGTRLGAVATPLLVVLCVLATLTALLTLVASVERPDARLRDVLKASLYLGVRRWYLTLVSLVVLGLLATLFALHPAVALGLASTPLLYAAWANSRYTLSPVLPRGATVAV
ncbi:DUF624 domain-containing protein [Occultella glacieicola]|uniref:DUF624 domain-containing protein n=1 Tax=Occultella glacieicola TaxID=2518684 RepID=A0ABY2EDE2_9MICO|nr:DUF624 domain-containing protein [Occultella glacieicola]TDE98827.1 DUF624 domain-containing protein [Occultella glacieicola]